MTKWFCDGCGEEITAANNCEGGHMATDRLGVELEKGGHRFRVELLVFSDGTANSGLFCRYCVLDAFNQLDKRPRAADQSQDIIEQTDLALRAIHAATDLEGARRRAFNALARTLPCGCSWGTRSLCPHGNSELA